MNCESVLDAALSYLVGYNIKYGGKNCRKISIIQRRMNMDEKRILELENLIRHHNDLYWNGRQTEISDVEYDKLIEELKQLDPENELVQTFAKPDISNTKLIKHSSKMLSLDKIYSKEDLFKWVKKISRTENEKFIIQPKYDGMSGLLENGKLSSRGDGEYGQDYTDKLSILNFIGLPENFDKEKDKILGEILITNSDFITYYPNILSKNGVPFKNQRNGIAGILGTDDVDFYKKQNAKISFVVYNSFGFRVSAKDFENKWDIAVEKIRNVNYPIDGIVIKLEDEEYGKSLGETAHHPKNAVAFKFTNQTAISVLEDIEWGMGKSQISAIGIIKPVTISGSTIKRVKLQLTKPKNTDVETYLLDGSLQIGDTIIVEKAGDIIPHVVSSQEGKDRKRIELKSCPFCNGEIIINDTSIICNNTECKEKLIQNLYCSLVTLGIKNIGESYIRLLVNDKDLNIKDLYDILTLDITDLNKSQYGIKNKETFISECQKIINNCTKVQMLTALNIPNIGKTVSTILVNNFAWDNIVNNMFDINKLFMLNGIGETIIHNIRNGFKEKEILIKKLNELFKFNDKKVENMIQENKNKLSICFTGTMSKSRKELQEIAESRGLINKDSVNKDLNILVCADPNSGSTKLQKASKYGIKIISEDDFLNKKY